MAHGLVTGWHLDATWLGWAGSRINAIGPERVAFIAAVSVLLVLALIQTIVVLRLRRRVQAPSFDAKFDKLTAAIALLTDTTESGLTSLAIEIQRVQRTQATLAAEGAKAATPRAVRKRVVAARARGESIASIAKNEAVPEDAVHLHAVLAAATTEGENRGGVRA